MEWWESEQLNKLSAIMESPESVSELLSILWKTRKSGLSSSDKSAVQSLLRLPSVSDVDPVVASVRVLIRKCLQKESCSRGDIMEMLPPGASVELRDGLGILLEEKWSQWKEEVSTEQRQVPRGTLPYHAFMNGPSFPLLKSQWSWQDRPALHRSEALPIPNQQDLGPLNYLETLPRLTSMTWALEEKASAAATRVAIITLKLLDNSKPAPEEIEVKFRVTRATLESMIQSVTNISTRFTRMVGSSELMPQQQEQ